MPNAKYPNAKYTDAQCPMPNAKCQMPQCPNAPMPNAKTNQRQSMAAQQAAGLAIGVTDPDWVKTRFVVSSGGMQNIRERIHLGKYVKVFYTYMFIHLRLLATTLNFSTVIYRLLTVFTINGHLIMVATSPAKRIVVTPCLSCGAVAGAFVVPCWPTFGILLVPSPKYDQEPNEHRNHLDEIYILLYRNIVE